MESLEKRLLIIAVMIALTMTAVNMAFADPAGAGVGTATSDRANVSQIAASSLPAQGGNVTNVNLNGAYITNKWTGFYGDVTAEIQLADASSNRFYNWTDSNPTGAEIFASRSSTVNWGGIQCSNLTHVETENIALNLSATSEGDNITNTFCPTCGNHSAFTVAGTAFTADQCDYRTNAFSSGVSQTTNWDQIILYDGTIPVYTTLMNDSSTAFDGTAVDFQLLVAENSTTDFVTTYFFYVEI